jgi:hypothetical protein
MIDLTETLFQQRSKGRGDGSETHFGDLYQCHRAVAYRRRGEKPEPNSRETLAKFAIGHAYEAQVAKTLREAGHKVEHDPENFVVHGFGIDVGHPDLFVDDELVLEIKTSGARKPKDEVQPHHAVQVAASALAIAEMRGLPPLQAAVLVHHASNIETVYPVDPEAYRDPINQLARAVIDLTAPDAALPPPEPPGWLPYTPCDGYCEWVQCSRNKFHGAWQIGRSQQEKKT